VYRVGDKNEIEFFKSKEWRSLRDRVLSRDCLTCQRCDKKYQKTELTVHHLVPRSEGGADAMPNLITLCSPCHDHVEVNDLRTRAAIAGSIDFEIIEGLPAEEGDWHSWVYGGARNPGLDKKYAARA